MSEGFRCEHITKNLNGYRIHDIGFSLEPGTVLGVVGVNGCGKTTLLRVFTGSYRVTDKPSDSGECRLDGFHFTKDVKEYRKRIAYVMQECPFRTDMTAEQVGEVYGPYYESFDPRGYLARLAEYGVPKRRQLAKMSKGQQLRVQLAFAESHEASLYVMDEPMGYFDPEFREVFYEKIRAIAATEKASVILSSHLVTELETVADRLLWMRRSERGGTRTDGSRGSEEGTVWFFGSIDELREKYRMISAEAEEIEALPKELIVGKRIRKNHCEALLRKPADGAGFPQEIDGKCRYADLQEIMYYTEKAEKEGEEG
ncbi:MAG: ABC transporter ATP-binding protein [Lachnospiraceae bacterium]|nr:ABC transporter ATP-binding protein [Lachnospiraceae bacterium]